MTAERVERDDDAVEEQESDAALERVGGVRRNLTAMIRIGKTFGNLMVGVSRRVLDR